MAGRPSKILKLGDEICKRIATSRYGLHRICADIGDIHPSTVYDWLERSSEFADKYARAKEMQADYMSELRLDVASGDYRSDQNNSDDPVFDSTEAIQRDRLFADHLKWEQSKLAPKKYGDKLAHEVAGKDGGAIEHSVVGMILGQVDGQTRGK